MDKVNYEKNEIKSNEDFLHIGSFFLFLTKWIRQVMLPKANLTKEKKSMKQL